MDPDGGNRRAPRFLPGLPALVILAWLTASARAQGPQFDVGAPPGAARGASTLGQPLGAADFPDYQTPSITPFSGRAGPAGSRAPAGALTPPGAPVFRTSARSRFAVQPLAAQEAPAYGDLALPEQ